MTLLATWDDLSDWQKSEVGRRYQGYVGSSSNTPPAPEIYIPIDSRRFPDDYTVYKVSDGPPPIPTFQRAVYHLVKFPNGQMDYKFVRIE